MIDERDAGFVKCEGALSLRRVHGSWRGLLPDDYVACAELSGDGSTARVELFDRVCELRLHDRDVRVRKRQTPIERQLEARFVGRYQRAREATEERGPSRTLFRLIAAVTSASGRRRYALVTRSLVYDDTGERECERRRVVEVSTGREVVRLGLRWPAAFSSCGLFLVFRAGAGASLTVVELATGARREAALPPLGSRPSRRFCVGPAASFVVVALDQRAGELCCIDLATGSVRWRVHAAGQPAQVRPGSADEGDLVWCEEPGWLEAYRASDGARVRRIGGAFERVSYGRDGRYALSVREVERSVARVDLRSGELVGSDAGPGGAVLALAWEKNGARFARVHATGRLRVSDATTGATRCDAELTDGEAPYTAVALAFVPGASSVSCVFERDETLVCERISVATGRSEATTELGGGYVRDARWAPDASALWVLRRHHEDGKAWESAQLYSAGLQRVLVEREGGAGGCAVAFTEARSNGALLALFANVRAGVLLAFDASTGASRFSSPLTPREVRVMAWSRVHFEADGAHVLFEGAQDNAGGIFSRGCSARGRCRRVTLDEVDGWTPEAPCCVGVSSMCVVEEAGSVRVYELRTGESIGSVALEGVGDEVSALALSPDERTLLVGTRAGVVLEFAVTGA